MPQQTLDLFGEDGPSKPFTLVPHEIFLTWPIEAQVRYCAMRDRDSASMDNDPGWREFYTERANTYDSDLRK